MLNTYNKYNNEHNHNIKINACNGGIYKTYKESWFKNIDIDDLFGLNDPQNKYYNTKIYYDSPVVIIQIILCGENKGIAEIMYKEDFDKYFEVKEVLENE